MYRKKYSIYRSRYHPVSGIHWGFRTYPLWIRWDYCIFKNQDILLFQRFFEIFFFLRMLLLSIYSVPQELPTPGEMGTCSSFLQKIDGVRK